MLEAVASTAQESGVALISSSVGDVQTDTLGDMVYQVRPVGITLDGDVINLYRFLTRLQQEIPVVAASKVRLSNLDTSPSAQVQLLFFLSPEPFVEEEQAG